MVALSDELVQLSKAKVPVPVIISGNERVLFEHEHITIDSESVDLVSLKSAPLVSERRPSLVRMASQIHVFRIGVIFAANSCCASGVNNALSGLYEYSRESKKFFQLLGIVGGPAGLAARSTIPIDSSELFVGQTNLGGTELLGYSSFSGIDLDDLKNACMELDLTSLVIIAASDELPHSVQLSNLLKSVDVCVSIVPQSRNQHVYIPNGICATSLGFDSARRILAELAGNIAVDCLASKKYWHFINAGDAGLVAEVGLLIRANMIVTEADPSRGIKEWVSNVCQLIQDRVSSGFRSGVVMVSQCAFSRSSEVEKLRDEISLIETFPVTESIARKQLSKESFAALQKLPKEIKFGLLRQRDAAGKPVLNYWSPEEFLVDEVKAELSRRGFASSAIAFRTHFLAHESRCPVPTVFDSVLGSCLGRTAAAFILKEMHGYMVSMRGLDKPVSEWSSCGVRILDASSSLIHQRGYELRPEIAAVLAELEPKWRMDSRYRSFGPLQITLNNVNALEMDYNFLPLSIMAQKTSLVDLMDGSGVPCETRLIPNVNPPIRLPTRRVADMSPVETLRREYAPCIPSYLSEPFAVVDSDICARVFSPDAEGCLEKLFPHSSKLLPVEIISISEILTSGRAAALHDRMSPKDLVRSSKSFRTGDVSEGSDSDGEAPPSSSQIQSRIHIPLLDRLGEVPSYSGENLMSPRSSARTLPPAKPQLVRASDVSWRFDTLGKVSPVPTTSARTVSVESIDSLDRLIDPSASHPLRVGVVFMCSQVPGCHNVVAGLFDYLGSSDGRQLIGFLGGSTGLKNQWTQTISKDLVDQYRNQGGQDLLGHFGESLSSDADYESAIKSIGSLALDGLVIVGNLEGQLAAAVLSEKLLEKKSACRVVSVPTSAENEIPFVRQSIGYDTVTRVFSNAIANLWTESHSSRHRWYFVRLMSHHVSHLALECGLATHPNIVLVTEEVAARKQSLAAVSGMIADCICARSKEGKDYGVVLIPDGVAAAVPEIKRLFRELDKIVGSHRMGSGDLTVRLELISAQLSVFSSAIFQRLPRFVQAHLVNGALRHAETGKIDIANVAIERVLQSIVSEELEKRRKDGTFAGRIGIHVHSLAHQGRSSLPSSFDCDLAYTCGYTAGVLVDAGRTGMVTNVDYHTNPEGGIVWTVGGFPAVALVQLSKEENSARVSIEPTKLVMSGSACRALFDKMPLPKDREGRQTGPLQWTDERSENSSQLSEGNRQQWESFESIAGMCREILALTGRQIDRNNDQVIESVVQSLENILRFQTKDHQKPTKKHSDWFLNEPDDILSTCAPVRIVTYD